MATQTNGSKKKTHLPLPTKHNLKHTEDANGQATVITYSDNLIKNTVGPALGAVADVLHEIFQFQQWSFSLADAIRDVGEECLDNLEQLTTECTLGKASA